MDFLLRKAAIRDVPQMQKLVNSWAKEGLMLPRSLHSLYEYIRDYTVAEVDGRVAGCVALHVTWVDLAEIRTLAVDRDLRGQGIGRTLARVALREAEDMGLAQVFVLTYVPEFFARFGFREVNKSRLPQKIWQECVHCPHFPDCGETAMTLDLSASTSGPATTECAEHPPYI